MNDLLLRVWNLLAENERPEGLECYGGGWFERYGNDTMPDATAYDRLCQAAERKLLEGEGLEIMFGRDGKYHWGYHDGEGSWLPDASDHDRLTAAALALEAGKGESNG